MLLPVAARNARIHVADFWDDYLARWLAGNDELYAPLDRWYEGYRGSGPGELDLGSYPDPYVGDLRGDTREPRIVMLGINPGVGYAPLQGRDGLWAQRIRQQSLSGCFSRSPEEDQASWRSFHGKRSRFWIERMKFANAWLPHSADIKDVLMMELYQWHSRGLSAPVTPPTDLVEKYFFEPISEVAVSHVFAFSSDWLRMARKLELKCVFSEVLSRNISGGAKWTLNVFDLSPKQCLVISTYPNSQPPYGHVEFEMLIEILDRLGRPRKIEVSVLG